VQIWDLQRPTLSQFFEIGSMREIWHVRSTPNYVVCVGSLRQTDSVSIIAVNKKDHLKEIRIEGPTDHFSLQSYGVFCAFLTMGGKLCVWEDLPDEGFKLVRTISPTGKSSLKATLWPGTVQMYRNWVCVSKDNVFRIFDVRTGAEIAAPRKNFVDAFRLNGQTLLARHTDMGPFLGGANTYLLYDFRERVRQLPLEDVRKQKEPSFGCPSM
jgi:WD40 repeat protein